MDTEVYVSLLLDLARTYCVVRNGGVFAQQTYGVGASMERSGT